VPTFYQEINPLQEPFDLGVDDLGRVRIAFNISVVKRPSDTFAEEIVKLLTTAGVGIAATNIFIGSGAAVSPGDGPYLNVVETGGLSPRRTHNSVATPAYTRPSAQIVARAKTYAAARTMARNAYNALVGVRNTTITL
jgi:hypothetical protein